MRRLLTSALFTILAVAGGACGHGGSNSSAAASLPRPAPELQGTAHNGVAVKVRTPTGNGMLVYFYPKDDTPGCTKEACALRDAWSKYETAGIQVVGVSTDSDESHRAFAEKHKLPFPLIADEDKAWAQAFGVSTTFGMAKRMSFLIDSAGNIRKVYENVDPAVHANEVLQDARTLLP